MKGNKMNEKVFWYDDRDIAENYIIAHYGVD